MTTWIGISLRVCKKCINYRENFCPSRYNGDCHMRDSIDPEKAIPCNNCPEITDEAWFCKYHKIVITTEDRAYRDCPMYLEHLMSSQKTW